jgi:hypothetical protein
LLPSQDSAVQSLVFLWGRKHEGEELSVCARFCIRDCPFKSAVAILDGPWLGTFIRAGRNEES